VCCHTAGEAMVSLGGVTRAVGVEPDDPSMLRRLPDGGRCVETMWAFKAVLEDPMMERLLQPPILFSMRQHFDKNGPMLDVLDGRKSHGRNSKTMKKDPVQVERAAGVVWEWLSDEGGSVLGFLQVLRNGAPRYFDGIGYAYAKFSDNVHRCASGIKAMTMTKMEYQSIMIAWLCFGGRVDTPADCTPTQIEADASSSDDGSCHSIATSDATSMAGPVTADDIHYACYRQLNPLWSVADSMDSRGLSFGTLAVERQSRGAIHVHSMAWADPSDSVQ
jgi:hypothetical protein